MADPTQIPESPDKYLTPKGVNPLFVELFPEAQLDIVREKLLKVSRTNNADDQFGTLKSYIRDFSPIQLIFLYCLLDYQKANPLFKLSLEFGNSMKIIFEDEAFTTFAKNSGFINKLGLYVKKVAPTDSVKTLIGSNAEHQLALYILEVLSRIQPYVDFLEMDNDFSDDLLVEDLPVEQAGQVLPEYQEVSEVETEKLFKSRMLLFIKDKYKLESERIVAKKPQRSELPITIHNIYSVLSLKYRPYTLHTALLINDKNETYKVKVPLYTGVLEMSENKFKQFILEVLKTAFPEATFLENVIINLEQ